MLHFDFVLVQEIKFIVYSLTTSKDFAIVPMRQA